MWGYRRASDNYKMWSYRGVDANLTIICAGGYTFKTHDFVLAENSEYFEALFRHRKSQKNYNRCVVLDHFDIEVNIPL